MTRSIRFSSLRPAGCPVLLLLIGTVLTAEALPTFGATPAPAISGYAATNPRGVRIFSAPPGAPLLIVGANLGSSGTVAFGGFPAPPPASWSATEILVIVPAAASYPFTAPVTVTTNGQTASGPAFTITPPPPPPPAPGPRIGYHLGDLAPDLTLNNQNGKPVSLSDYAGKSILMTFSAAWCGPCIDAAPREEAVARTLNQNKEPTQLLEVLVEDPFGEASIDTDAQDWADQFGLTDPVLQMDGDPNSPGCGSSSPMRRCMGAPPSRRWSC